MRNDRIITLNPRNNCGGKKGCIITKLPYMKKKKKKVYADNKGSI
jgi:hypothetical protein